MTDRMCCIAILLIPTLAAGDEPKAILDCSADERLLDTRFVRFGTCPKGAIVREGSGVRFRLPASKDFGQSGLYSYVALAGDFDHHRQFEWAGVPVPKLGYGARCGIAVDTSGPAGSLSLARATVPGKGAAYVVTRPGAQCGSYVDQHFPTKAMKGRLELRRMQSEIVCLAQDGDKGELVELCRLPFSDATIRQVRIFADLGGADATLDARISHLRVVAEEITARVPERERRNSGSSWPYFALAGLVCVVAYTFTGVARIDSLRSLKNLDP